MSRGEAAGHSGTRRNPAPKDKPKRSACPAAKPRGTAGHSKPPAPPKKQNRNPAQRLRF